MSFLDTLIFGYRTILSAGTQVVQRSKVNFVGATVADNPTTGATDITISGTTPSGTGLRKVVAGVEAGAAATLVNADVNAAAAIAVSKLAAGTNTYVLTTTAGVPVWAAPTAFTPPTGTGVALVSGGALVGAAGTVNLASGTYVTGTLGVGNGGTGITSLGTGVATFMGTPSSANLAAALTDETGTGSLVFGTTPTFKTSVKLNNPADTFAYTFTPAAIAAARTITLPLLAGNDTMVCEAFTQTLTNKTLTSPTITSPAFGSSTIGTSGYFTTSGNVSGVGQFRLAHGDKISYRNSANSADATFMHTASDVMYVGLNSGFTETAFSIIQCPSSQQYLGVASNYFLIITNNLLEINAPMLGYSGAEFAVHGAVVSAMGDADYTVATADKRVESIAVTTVMTAGRTMTWPHPSSMDRSYKKMIFNNGTLQTLTISTGTGTTKTLATGLAQWFEFTTGGVRFASGTFTP